MYSIVDIETTGHSSKITEISIFIFDGKFAGNIYNSFREKIPASEATKLWEYFQQGSDE